MHLAPTEVANSRLVNSARRPSRLPIAALSLSALISSLPPFCASMPTSIRRENGLLAVTEPIMPRSAFCRPTAVLSPCSEPAVLVLGLLSKSAK